MDNEKNKDSKSLDRYSIGPWIGLAIGVGMGLRWTIISSEFLSE